MLVMGLDPGTAITGYGLVREERGRLKAVHYGALRTSPDMPAPERLRRIYDEMAILMDAYRPDLVSIEQLFFNRNVTTALAVGQARGVALLAAAKAGVAVVEYTPLQVKQTITGNGRADKEQVGFMVKALLKLENVPRPDDVADALAIAICHIHNAGALWGIRQGG